MDLTYYLIYYFRCIIVYYYKSDNKTKENKYIENVFSIIIILL